jgi:IclR family pca regulon transcriptional regulator
MIGMARGTIHGIARATKDAISPGGDTLRTLARGLALLECFTPQRPSLGHSEIVAALGLPQATVARFLQSLKQLGYLSQTADRRYQLTVRALRLTQSSVSSLSLPSWLFSRLERAAARTGEMWQVGVLDGQYLVTVAFGGGTMFRGDLPLGARTPAYPGGGAAAILAFSAESEQERYIAEAAAHFPEFEPEPFRRVLAETRARGFASRENHQWQPPLAVLAAPVWGAEPSPVAALAVTTSLSRCSLPAFKRMLAPELLDMGRSISEDLGARCYPPAAG